MVLLTLLSIVLVLVLVGALVVYLAKIIGVLEAVGGSPDSLLAKVRWGLRAIQKQTDAIGPQVTQLNAGLGAIEGGLGQVETNLTGLGEALGRQGATS
ncbi:MAG: hypothetical protein ACR2GQ_10830 [Gemmatimonadota bacterium]|jgi:predicted PurR-regulated permease PerM